MLEIKTASRILVIHLYLLSNESLTLQKESSYIKKVKTIIYYKRLGS